MSTQRSPPDEGRNQKGAHQKGAIVSTQRSPPDEGRNQKGDHQKG